MGIVLFENKKSCCGCGACVNICPKQAITMQTDECGFSYPVIDSQCCVSCGACKTVCSYQNGISMNKPIQAYAAVNKVKEQLEKSASGGIFAAVATYFLKNDGVVYGATLDFEDGHPKGYIIEVNNINELYRIQGSKYVQCSVEYTYSLAKKNLDLGKNVLFSGTPCQIAGLYGYLKREYENLWTIDVICHGVPNMQFFDEFLTSESKKYKGIPIGYSFRDKKKGWGMNTRLDIKDMYGNIEHIFRPARLASYNTLFLDGEIYRENCYTCPYAHKERVSDVTIGDYWGILNEHPEILKKENFDEKKGISCVLVNTKKGKKLCENLSNNIGFYNSSFEKIAKKNGQLNHPSNKPDNRKVIMEIYRRDGYEGVEKWFYKTYKKQIVIHRIYNMIPRSLRMSLKNQIQKRKGN